MCLSVFERFSVRKNTPLFSRLVKIYHLTFCQQKDRVKERKEKLKNIYFRLSTNVGLRRQRSEQDQRFNM